MCWHRSPRPYCLHDDFGVVRPCLGKVQIVKRRSALVWIAILLSASWVKGETPDERLPTSISSLPGLQPGNSATSGLPSTPLGTAGRVSDGLAKTFLALGASSGIPDGIGGWWYPSQRVLGQKSNLGMTAGWAGAAVPVWDDETDGLFLTGAARAVNVNTNAILPDDHTRFPSTLWDIQSGAVYLRRMSGDRAWGLSLTAGSASDRPFHSIREATATGLTFYRTPAGDEDHWLFYVLSESTGQIGRNFPIPGVAYEFSRSKLNGVVGIPFLSLAWTPKDQVEATLFYAALSDLQIRVSYEFAPKTKAYTGFVWTYASWFRADRVNAADQFFWYEKRLEMGTIWTPRKWVSFQASGGYAFDRYFTETHGLSLSGRNRISVGSGPLLSLQILAQY